jgi:two-component system NarL family response regulator
MIRILIADDHPFFLDGLEANLEAEDDFAVVGRAGDGREAVSLCARLLPDVALVDLRMPEMGGVEAIREIGARSPATRVVVLTTFDGDEEIYRALKAGAKAYLLKDVFREELVAAIRSVAAGRRHLPSAVAERLAERAVAEELTSRELDVLRLVARGQSNREIGAALTITEATVKAHLTSIFDKLAAKDRTHAAMIALRRGLLRLD